MTILLVISSSECVVRTMQYFFAYHYRYYETMRRRNYVTPTSYLELIKTFKSLLDHKRMEILTLKNRYIVGLEKLEFSESQVGGLLPDIVLEGRNCVRFTKYTYSLKGSIFILLQFELY